MYIFQQSFISNCDMLIKCTNFYRTYYNLFKALDLSCFPEKTTMLGDPVIPLIQCFALSLSSNLRVLQSL